MSEISVIMATYKENETFLRQSIESVLNQTYRDFEYIIILDDPKNQEHIDIITEYAKKDQRIRFYINEKNMGIQRTANRGLSLATGTYIARMDADDVCMLDRLEKQIKYIETQNYDYIGGATEVIDESGKKLYEASQIPLTHKTIMEALKYNQVIANSTVFAKKEVFEKLNGYRETMAEDYDFTLRAALNGYKLGNIPDIVLRYRMTANSISRNNLLIQFLYAKYYALEFQHGREADLKSAQQYVDHYNKEQTSRRYALANQRFNQTLDSLTNKKYLDFLKNGFLLVFTSRIYLTKIYRFARAAMKGK